MELESWSTTESLDRTCGFINVSAVVKALEAEAKEEISGGTQVTTKDFCWYPHKPAGKRDRTPTSVRSTTYQFEVQDKAWTYPSHKRMQLRIVPRTTATDVLRMP